MPAHSDPSSPAMRRRGVRADYRALGAAAKRLRGRGQPADGARPAGETLHKQRGSRTVNSLYSPTLLSTLMVPPCCCVMRS
jgi:hypothetical protein